MREERNALANIDWQLIGLFLVLCLLGWLNIYSSAYSDEPGSIFALDQRAGKQFLWIGTSIVMALFILFLDGKLIGILARPIYAVSMLSLLGVLIFGTEIAGARSWYTIGSFSLQPSEFAKFATALALASYLSRESTDLSSWKTRVIAFGIFLLPMVLIIPQPDPGSALVFASLFLVLYREGLSGIFLASGITLVILFLLTLLVPHWILFTIISAVVLFLVYLGRRSRSDIIRAIVLGALAAAFISSVDFAFENILEDRHRNRINILLGKASDPTGIGYNTEQSKIAIGSGGVFGKGYLNGTQTKFNFVPEQSTDFIFCTVGEEWGWMGSSVVILLYVWLILRLLRVAERQRSRFSRIYGYGVLSILLFHFSINIAMTIGLAPVIGIPLPFFSYGGSSLWGFTLLLFIFIKLDAYRMQVLR
jgi:rod shape determining protein RodA